MESLDVAQQSPAPISIFVDASVACSSTRADTFSFIRNLPHRIADGPEDADIALISSCAYSAEMQSASLRNIDAIFGRLRPGARVVVSGCLAAIDPAAIRSKFDVDLVPPGRAHEFVSLLGGSPAAEPFVGFSGRAVTEVNMVDRLRAGIHGRADVSLPVKLGAVAIALLNRSGAISRLQHWRMFRHLAAIADLNERAWQITVSQGCVGRCTFCAIPQAKGRTRSAPMGYVVQSVREAVDQGAEDIVLVSEDVGAYGIDTGTTIVTLLEQLAKLPEKFTLYVHNFDPRWLGKYRDGLLDQLRAGRVRGLQLPLQSASDRVLRLMARGYSATRVLPIIEKIRADNPDLMLATHFIAGFPSETMEDHRRTLAVIRSGLFHLTQIFPYSARPNTKAIEIPDPLSEDEVVRRGRELNRAAVRSMFRTMCGIPRRRPMLNLDQPVPAN